MSANNTQVGGNHYKDRVIQPWDFIISNDLGFLEGNIVKYVTRYKDKNGIEDLYKARHYLGKLIEVQEEEINNQEIKMYGSKEFDPKLFQGYVEENLMERK